MVYSGGKLTRFSCIWQFCFSVYLERGSAFSFSPFFLPHILFCSQFYFFPFQKGEWAPKTWSQVVLFCLAGCKSTRTQDSWMFRDNRWFQMVLSLRWRFPPTLPMNRRALSFHQETLGFAWLWGGAPPLYISQQYRGLGAQALGLANLPAQHSSTTRLLISWAILLNFRAWY